LFFIKFILFLYCLCWDADIGGKNSEGGSSRMIGKRIHKARLEKELSLSELADRAGVSKSYLSYIERDLQNNPSIQVLSRIASVLGLDVESLLHEESSKELNKGLEQEWLDLVNEAMKAGLNKERLSEYKDLIEFIKWRNEKKNNKHNP
jgi:XRE family transcriptional regulator, master regulator for biofilm formation